MNDKYEVLKHLLRQWINGEIEEWNQTKGKDRTEYKHGHFVGSVSAYEQVLRDIKELESTLE